MLTIEGKAARFDAVYPDGSDEVLLSVPNYDFNWQTSYVLAEPKRIPAGNEDHVYDDLGQFGAEPGEPRPGQSGTVGPAILA